MQIRTALITDLPALHRIETEVFDDPWSYLSLRQFFDIAGELCVLAEDETPLGYAVGALTAGAPEGWILNIGVLAAARGKGAGRKLIDELVTRVHRCGARIIRLTVSPANAPARALFEAAGFRVERSEDGYFGPGHPRLIMKYAD